MLKRTISLAAAALLMGSFANAQSLFDYFSGFGQPSQDVSRQEKPVEFDYDIDFDYYTDIRDFDFSSELFSSTINLNLARLSPAFGIRYGQNGVFTHRLLAGVNMTKYLGANPTSYTKYSEDEAKESQLNANLFKEIFYYYNLQARLDNGRFDLFAGIYPRHAMEGEYGRAFFSETVLMTDPNMEGLMLKYRTPRFFAELGGDWSGEKGLDRFERFTLFSAGSFDFTQWLRAGWAATFMRVGGSYIFPGSFNNILAGPYVKVDFGRNLDMQEFSLKAEALASMQIDRTIESTLHFPMAGETTVRIKNWNLGIEDTFFYGDNMMPYKSKSYSEETTLDRYLDLMYLSDPFYFTHRGFAAGYDRVELFYEPILSSVLSLKVSAVGHFIFPGTEDFGNFLGWQAKASLIFDLDGLAAPSRQTAAHRGRRNTKQSQSKPRQNGGLINL